MKEKIYLFFVKLLFPLCIITILVAAHYNSFIHKMSAGLAVISGILLSLLFTNPFEKLTRRISSVLLSYAVIGLGFGMNLISIAKIGIRGIGYTVISIVFCSVIGVIVGRLLKIQRDTSVLITIGTAICGGSAIAAVAPTIKAKHHEISVALAIIFMLNAISLFIFPTIGHFFQLTQEQFGLWSALAIQDTSSVVGASFQYGSQALEVGTTVKLARALWIVPVTFAISLIYSQLIYKTKNMSEDKKVKKPWFILFFILAAALVTWIPVLRIPGLYLRDIAEQLLVIVLFCIGASLSRNTIKQVGMMPFVQGSLLWIIMSTLSLVAILFQIISL